MYRILIADDELLECRVLEKIIAQHCPEAEILPFARDGLELAAMARQYRPDIALVDINMPCMNGLDAVELIHGENPQLLVVVVTAYGEFAYAKKALSVGASEYLLKPVKEAELLKTLSSLFARCDQLQSHQRNQEYMEKIRVEYRDVLESDFLNEIQLGSLSERCRMSVLSHLSHPFCGGFVLWVQGVTKTKKTEAEGETDREESKEGREGGKAEEEVRSFLTRIRKETTALGKETSSGAILCLLPPRVLTPEEAPSWAEEVLRRALPGPQESWALSLGVSRYKRDMADLPVGYHESRFALHGVSAPGIFLCKEQEASLPLPRGSETADAILKAIREGNQVLALSLLQGFFSSLGSLKLERQKIRTLFVLRRITRQVSILRPEEPRDLFASWSYWERVLGSGTAAELIGSGMALLGEAFQGAEEEDCSRYILGSLRYMENHYTEELSLEGVADQVGISSFYLSRLFKQELGVTFLEVLTSLRLDRALQLLITTDLSAQVIGEQCGYLNPTYFYKVFKKHAGMTVGELRSLLDREKRWE